jgi:hypothetical protein
MKEMTTQNSELEYELDKAKDKTQKTERYLSDALSKLHNIQHISNSTNNTTDTKQQRDVNVSNKANITEKQVIGFSLSTGCLSINSLCELDNNIYFGKR